VLAGEGDFDDLSGVRDHQLNLPSLYFRDGFTVHAELDDLIHGIALKRRGYGRARKPPAVIVVVEFAEEDQVAGMARAAS